jgi:DNA-binding response OmpR family regulator
MPDDMPSDSGDGGENGGPRVLVVDATAQARVVVRDELGKRGYRAQTAADAAEALSLINSRPDAFDIIISEIILTPEMDGFAFLAEVRRGADTAALPFIFLTGDRRIANKVKALDLGVDDYITKPCSFDEFSARLAGIMRRCEALGARPEDPLPPAGEFDLAGDLSAIGVIEIVRMLTTNQKTGLLRLHIGARQAELYLETGKLCHATCAGAAEGLAAAEVLLQLANGSFDFRSDVPPPIRTISEQDSGVLLDAPRQADEAREAIRKHSERIAERRKQKEEASRGGAEEQAVPPASTADEAGPEQALPE